MSNETESKMSTKNTVVTMTAKESVVALFWATAVTTVAYVTGQFVGRRQINKTIKLLTNQK